MATFGFSTKAWSADKATDNYLERGYGVSRWTKNWSITRAKQIKQETNWLPSNYQLDKELRAAAKAKRDKGFEWFVDQLVSPRVFQEALKEVAQSFAQCRDAQKECDRRFFKLLHKKRKKRLKKKKVQPKLRSRKDPRQSFSMYRSDPTIFTIDGDHTISFAVGRGNDFKRGVLRTSESLAFLRKPGVKLCRLTIRREGNHTWVSISYERPNRKRPQPKGGKIGIDLGVKNSVVSFDGTKVEVIGFNTKESIRYDKLSKKLNKKLSRLKPGSRKFEEIKRLMEERAARSARIRDYNLEVATSYIAQNYKYIKIDDFGFLSALEVAEKDELYRCMKYQFKLRLEQKAAETGAEVSYVEHLKGEKTTMICSRCGSTNVQKDDDERVIHCRHCGLDIDRDENGARNAYKLIK